MKKGKLFVISGPSGAGKSTLSKLLIKQESNLFLSTSATTRAPREGEQDKVDYFFISKEEFEKNINSNSFLEYALVHGNYYGTLKSEVEKKLSEGKNVLLEIDVQGGTQVKEKFEDTILIFVKAPTETELEKRLRGRKTDCENVIKLRLENSLKELAYEAKYDKIVVNDTIENALAQLHEIVNN